MNMTAPYPVPSGRPGGTRDQVLVLPPAGGGGRTGRAARAGDLPPQPPDCVETTLIVDDNLGLRDYDATSLREVGYCVLEAERLGTALELLDRGNEIDLLFTAIPLDEMPSAAARSPVIRT